MENMETVKTYYKDGIKFPYVKIVKNSDNEFNIFKLQFYIDNEPYYRRFGYYVNLKAAEIKAKSLLKF